MTGSAGSVVVHASTTTYTLPYLFPPQILNTSAFYLDHHAQFLCVRSLVKSYRRLDVA